MSFLKADRPSMFDRAPAPPPATAAATASAVSRLFGGEEPDDADERAGEGIEAHAESDRFDLVTDTEYWIAACFQSRRQKDVFLAALHERFGLPGDDDKYLDGWELAQALGIALPREEVPYNTGKVDRKWLDRTR